MNDSDRMPFGQFKGRRMDQVPAKYLDWLIDQKWMVGAYPEVKEYIESNWSAIQIDLEKEKE